ncbi:hypothetical protein [Mesorhizobium sp.]|uniref:hypothetical protein n=1 Tax=Mesorhizobium sp. TaxID=1871066 RepID=UPI000FE7B282|nr:hypothetical protein [Mesorhizobium sp.]RWP54343.1 MAG: hypothetical protein EOR06_10770 [Mesorhizobium sp.]
MSKLFISVSHHQPRLLKTTPAGGESYAHDDAVTYVVLQPLVLEQVSGGPSSTDFMSVREYLRTWSTQKLADGVHLLRQAEIDLIKAQAVLPCMVPFPPGVRLDFFLRAKTRANADFVWSDTRVVGGFTATPPGGEWDQLPGDASTGWPAFATLSSALPVVTRFADLDAGVASGPQKLQAIRDLLGAFSRMATTWAVQDPPQPDQRHVVWSTLVKPLIANTPLSDIEAWRTHLSAPHRGGGTKAEWAYDTLIPFAKGDAPGSDVEPVIGLTSAFWEVDGVRTRPELFLTRDRSPCFERSYLDALWAEFRGLADKEEALINAGGSPPMPVRDILGRLFGFGERLAWPLARLDGGLAGSKRIMALTPNLSHLTDLPAWISGANWLATNAISLAGLVMRLQPYDAADPIESVIDCDLQIAGQPLVQDLGALKGLLQSGFSELLQVPNRTPSPAKAHFGAATGVQSAPATHPDRLVLFAARKAALSQLAAGQAPAGRVFNAVPEALLDVIDATPRFSDRGKDGAIVRNAPRRGVFHNELLDPAAFLRNAIDTWHRRSVNLTPRSLTGSAGVGFVMNLQEPVHVLERVVQEWFAALPSGRGFPEARLWIPTKDGAPGGEQNLPAGVVLRDADGAVLVVDPDPKAAGSLSQMLGFDSAHIRTFQAEIVFRTTKDPSTLFDVVELAPGRSSLPDLALAKGAVTRLGRSADRLLASIAVTWPVPFDPDYGLLNRLHPDMQTVEFSEANKLRLKLTLPDGETRDLSDPDAQLPLPATRLVGPPWEQRGVVSVQGPQGWFWLAEHFDQDAPGDRKGQEETRFQLWNSPTGTLKLNGYLEHQYGHRVGIETFHADLRRSVDLLNPADVLIADRISDVETRRRPLFLLAEKTGGTQSVIQVTLRREALKLAHRQFGDPAIGESVPGPLRDIYRSLAELRDSIAAGTATIGVESWVFDNRSMVGAGSGATMGLGMRPLSVAIAPLSMPAPGSELDNLFAALSGKFEDFKNTCEAVGSSANPAPVLYEVPSSNFDSVASMVRVRLSLERPVSTRAEREWSSGAFIPLAEGGPEAGAALADVAQADLKSYLEDPDSRLSRSVAWFECEDRKAENAGVGPGSSKFVVPEGETAPVSRVADLFYMPHAFLVPDGHAWLGDRRATTDFLSFVLAVVQDVLSGRSIQDRLNLEILGPSDAVALRTALRGTLDAPDGALSRMMRLFRRVDVHEPVPPADIEGLLHWHAGTVLESLSLLGIAGPDQEVRGRLLEEPTLFTSLRGIGIGVFNRRLARWPDPAPKVNHTTFSVELIELGLVKHLIDDRERVQEDRDKFTAADLRGAEIGGEPAFYFVDLLPDRFYDDLVEIRSNRYIGVDPFDTALLGEPRDVSELANASAIGDAIARRGEEVLYPPNRGKVSFAANVVHVFPDWRVLEDRPGTTKQLRSYYLLPERTPPPRARPVDANQQGVSRGRNEIALSFKNAPTGPMPPLSPDGQWPDAYKAIADSLAWVNVKPASGDLKLYRRIERAAKPQGPTAYLPKGQVVAGSQTRGWHLLTTYLSHFWFELDLQTPGKTWSENLEDDTYDIEVELWPSSPPASADQNDPSPSIKPDILLNAFRRTRPSPGAVVPPVPAITRKELEDGVSAWLRTGQEGRTLIEEPRFLDKQDLRDGAFLRTFRISRPVGMGEWTLHETTEGSSPDALGAVVGFEVLARTTPDAIKGPKYDDAVSLETASVLIRATVLDHPFRISRARLRVARNWRDVGGDRIPDIAPEFILADRFSDWKSEGREAIEVDESDFTLLRIPDAGRELRATAVDALPEWLLAMDISGEIVDHGSALPNTLEQKVFLNIDNALATPEGLWEPRWMSSPDFAVSGVVFRWSPDPSFLYGKGNESPEITTRSLVLAGDPLGDRPGDRLGELLTELRPSRIKSDRPLVSLTWRDKENMPVLKVSLPLNLKP